MEENSSIQELKTSFVVNIWVERNNFIVLLMVVIVAAVYGRQFNLMQLFELFVGSFLFAGIVFFGFVGIALHIRYYFHYEKYRSVKLFADRLVISIEHVETAEIFKKDIVKIILRDRINSSGRYQTFVDPFYYLIVVSQNHEPVILTCILDMNLKKKIAGWYGQELEHKYQFFPSPLFEAR